jgi:hypothetical protein
MSQPLDPITISHIANRVASGNRGEAIHMLVEELVRHNSIDGQSRMLMRSHVSSLKPMYSNPNAFRELIAQKEATVLDTWLPALEDEEVVHLITAIFKPK